MNKEIGKFKLFDSVADFVADLGPIENHKEYEKIVAKPHSPWWDGSVEKALKLCKCGDLAAVAEAEKLADMICDSVDVSGLVPSWRLDVSGAFACVSEYLAGSPECMFAQVPQASTASPLKIMVELGAAANIKAGDLNRRAICLLAAVMAIDRVRPVELSVYSVLCDRPVIIKLSTPLDVSEVCGILQACVYRRLVLWHNWQYNRDARGHRAGWFGDDDLTKSAIGSALGCEMNDIVLLTRNGLSNWAEKSQDKFIEELNEMIRNVAAVDSSTAAA